MYTVIYIPTGETYETEYDNFSDFLSWYDMLFDDENKIFLSLTATPAFEKVISRYRLRMALSLLKELKLYPKVLMNSGGMIKYIIPLYSGAYEYSKSEFSYFYRSNLNAK